MNSFDLEWTVIAVLGVAVVFLILWASVRSAARLARWLSWRWACARNLPVPEDGEPLRGGEIPAFTSIVQGRNRTVPEPAYDRRRRQA